MSGWWTAPMLIIGVSWWVNLLLFDAESIREYSAPNGSCEVQVQSWSPHWVSSWDAAVWKLLWQSRENKNTPPLRVPTTVFLQVLERNKGRDVWSFLNRRVQTHYCYLPAGPGHVSQKSPVLREFIMALLTPTPLRIICSLYFCQRSSAWKGGGWVEYMVGEDSPLLRRDAVLSPHCVLRLVSSWGDEAGPLHSQDTGSDLSPGFFGLTRMFWKSAHFNFYRNRINLCSGKPFPHRP